MKVLVIAYACEPYRGSEPGVGWNFVKQISGIVEEVHVFTKGNNVIKINDELKKKNINNVKVKGFEINRFLRKIKKTSGFIQLYYYLWLIKAYFLIKKLNKKERFDIVHHVTFVNDWLPSYPSILPIPFVWGPVGGSNMFVPASFYKFIGIKNSLKEILRKFFQKLFIYLDPSYRLTLKRSKKIIVCNNNSYNNIPKRYHYKTEIHTQMGISNVSKYYKRNNKKLRIVYGGLLLYWKGINLVLDGFIKFHKIFPNSELIIIGSGPEEYNLKKVVKNNDLNDNVTFINFLPQKEFMNELKKADVFLFPSFHDSGGMVIVEAMSFGVPVICLDIGGPGFSVTEKTGIKIKPINPNQTIECIVESLIKLAKNPKLREKMGRDAIERVKKEFLWENKQKLFKRIYSEVKE